MKQCNILIINPPVYDFSAYDLWAKPLGLLYIAAILRSHGCQVSMIDYMDRTHPAMPPSKNGEFGCGHYFSSVAQKPHILAHVPRTYRRFGLPATAATAILKNTQKPQAILISSTMTYWYPGVIEAITLARTRFPYVPIILGGTYATLCTDHAKTTSGADKVIPGHTPDDLIRALREYGLPLYEKALLNSFTDFPAPAYDLYPSLPYAAIRTSMGCPFNCTYCAISLLSHEYQKKDLSAINAEIKALVKRGIQNIAFYDDALLFQADKHLIPLLTSLVEKNRPLKLHTPNGLHSRYVSFAVALAMKSGNFIMPRLSLETANETTQQQTGGKVSRTQFETGIENLRLAGYQPGDYAAYLMMGIPNQSIEEVETTIRYAHSLGAHISLGEYSPIPGTKDWDIARKNLPSEDPLLHNNSIFPMHPLPEWPKLHGLKNLAKTLNRKLSPPQ